MAIGMTILKVSGAGSDHAAPREASRISSGASTPIQGLAGRQKQLTFDEATTLEADRWLYQ